jgi:hypothetical protein
MPESIPEPPSAGIPAIVAAIVGRGSAAQPSVTIPNPGRQSPERGASIPVDMILFDAVGSAVANFVGDATNAVRQRAQESLREAVTVPIYRLSLGMAALGLGVGAYGLAIGTYDLRSIGELLSNVMSSLLGGGSGGGSSSPRGSGGSASTPWAGLSMLMPSGGLVVGSTIASGTTAVVLGLFGITRTSSNNPGRGDTPPTQTTSNTNNKYQGDPPSQSRKS